MGDPVETAQSKLDRVTDVLCAAGIQLIPGFVTPGGTMICVVFGETGVAVINMPVGVASDYEQVLAALEGHFKVLTAFPGSAQAPPGVTVN